MKTKNVIKKVIISLLLFINLFSAKVYADASVSISVPSSVTVGDNVTITLNNNDADYVISGKLVVSGAASGTLNNVFMQTKDSQSITVKAQKTGTINIVYTGESAYILADVPSKQSISRSASINVKDVPANNVGNSNSGSSSGSGASNDTSVRVETPEERKAREEREAKAKQEQELRDKEAKLELRKKTPLIKDIVIVSESERLKGQEVTKLATEVETFKYSATLPRSIDAFRIDLKPIKDDVKLTYDKMYKLDEGHNKVEIVVKAVQDEVEQTFNITVNRHQESDVTFENDAMTYNLLVDKLIDNKLKDFGIERKLFNEKKDDSFYYYEYEGIKFALAYDNDNVARWVLLDDAGNFEQEFILLIDSNKKPRFIVDVPLDEEVPTLNGNRYEKTELPLSDEIITLDESMTFNQSVSAWAFDEEGVITHEYVKVAPKDTASTEDTLEVSDDKPYKLIYVGKDSVVESAFVSFDNVNKNMEYFAYTMLGLLILMIIIFIFYWRASNKKINQILSRR